MWETSGEKGCIQMQMTDERRIELEGIAEVLYNLVYHDKHVLGDGCEYSCCCDFDKRKDAAMLKAASALSHIAAAHE